MMYEIVNVDPRPVGELCPDCPPRLNEAVGTMLAKDRAKRYAHVDDIARDLKTDTASPVPSRVQSKTAQPRSRYRVRLGLIVAAAALALTFIGYVVLRGPNGGRDHVADPASGDAAGAQSIAVLPFLNMSPEKD